MPATILLPLVALAVSAQAMPVTGTPHAQCPTTPAPRPAGPDGWIRAQLVSAGGEASAAAALPIGIGTKAALLPTSKVAYLVPPEKPGDGGSSGGIFAIAIATAGRYCVALGAAAWIDVLSDKTPVASAAHGHGPDCSDIPKMVDFELKPGRHLLQVSGSGSPTLSLMVARLP